METTQTKAHFSIPSLLAIAAAFGTFAVGGWGSFILAIAAIFFGVIGLVLSFSPSVRGGVISVFSLILAVIGIIVAVIRALAWVV
jgi:hypothetical protein